MFSALSCAHQRFRRDAGDGEGHGRHALADPRRVGDAVDRQPSMSRQARRSAAAPAAPRRRSRRRRRRRSCRGASRPRRPPRPAPRNSRPPPSSPAISSICGVPSSKRSGRPLDEQRHLYGVQRSMHVAPAPQRCPYAGRRICRPSRRGNRSRDPATSTSPCGANCTAST